MLHIGSLSCADLRCKGAVKIITMSSSFFDQYKVTKMVILSCVQKSLTHSLLPTHYTVTFTVNYTVNSSAEKKPKNFWTVLVSFLQHHDLSLLLHTENRPVQGCAHVYNEQIKLSTYFPMFPFHVLQCAFI